MAGTKSFLAKPDETDKQWWLVDANDAVVGRLASDIAMVLMGKHSPKYTPHVDTGDYVVVINCEKVKFSGNKMANKTYTWFSGYTGLKTETARRMLPKNKLGVDMLGKLKIYKGDSHPHQAQNPQPLKLEAAAH